MSRASKGRSGKRWKLLPYLVRRIKARQERDAIVGWLRKKGKTPEATSLAEKLEGCQAAKRCGSGACPICTTIAQEHYARALRDFVATEKLAGEEMFTLTLVPENNEVAQGSLIAFDLKNFNRRLRTKLKPSSIGWGVGGIDLSFNEHETGRYQPHWSPHLFLIGVAKDLQALRKELHHLASKSEANLRPLMVQPWRGGYRAYLYALKPHFVRRVGTDKAKRFAKRAGMVRTCRGTTKQRLRSAERLELQTALDQWGASGRIFSLRSQVHHTLKSYQVRVTGSR